MTKRRSEIFKIVDGVQPLVDQFHELSDEDQRVFLDMVDPLPDEVEQPKKAVKKRRKPATRPPRAASLAGAIATRPKRTPDMPEAICTFQYHDESFCDQGESNLVHDKTAGYAGYHPFQPAVAQAASGGD